MNYLSLHPEEASKDCKSPCMPNLSISLLNTNDPLAKGALEVTKKEKQEKKKETLVGEISEFCASLLSFACNILEYENVKSHDI